MKDLGKNFTLNNTFTVDMGRKYYRVWSIDNQKSIHCFVDIQTGDVFKPESYNKPAKHVRYNLLDKQSRQSMFEKSTLCRRIFILKMINILAILVLVLISFYINNTFHYNPHH